jgi:ribitol-5-phosphate 2-dehydrogenase
VINRIYRLADAKSINMALREVEPGDDLILARPVYVSVCAADQRYYQGRRKREVMRQKLPMALIHEATATVLRDPGGILPSGAPVVPLPLVPADGNAAVKPNYDERSEFCSSGRDGFLRDCIASPPDGFIPLPGGEVVYVFSELISVVFNALEAFERSRATHADSFGVWGDGSMGYVAGLVLRCVFPDSKLFVFGKTARKMRRFSFADAAFFVDDVPAGLRVSHAFECAGGEGSESALRQIIGLIAPQGCVSLLGVSEQEISVNTRSVLEKGLKLIGNSRSSREDFVKAVELISGGADSRKYLETLISEIVDIRSEADIIKLFENDALNDFKTVGRWLI